MRERASWEMGMGRENFSCRKNQYQVLAEKHGKVGFSFGVNTDIFTIRKNDGGPWEIRQEKMGNP